jgi:hypothetical protein
VPPSMNVGTPQTSPVAYSSRDRGRSPSRGHLMVERWCMKTVIKINHQGFSLSINVPYSAVTQLTGSILFHLLLNKHFVGETRAAGLLVP